MTSPVAGSIVAPSVGCGLAKVKVPPKSPVIVAVPPSQVAVSVKLASSVINTVTSCVLLDGQVPLVVYSTV